nr:hypothetical protein CFP56_48969 [Quercus suber]
MSPGSLRQSSTTSLVFDNQVDRPLLLGLLDENRMLMEESRPVRRYSLASKAPANIFKNLPLLVFKEIIQELDNAITNNPGGSI